MRAQRKDGWVLIETLVAMVLLSVGVMAINRALVEALRTRAIAKDYTAAHFLLDEKMGELEMQPVLNEGDSGAGVFKDQEQFSFSWTVVRVDMPTPPIPTELQQFFLEPLTLPEPHLGRISVTIKWTRAGREFDAIAETLISAQRILTLEEKNALAQSPA